MREINKRLTQEQVAYIREHYLEFSDTELAKKFKVHETQVANARHRIKLCRERGQRAKGPNWNAAEEEYLSENWGRVTISTIVKRLLADGKSVQEIGKQLGMKPEEVFRLSDFSRDDFLSMMTKGVHGYSKAELLTKY